MQVHGMTTAAILSVGIGKRRGRQECGRLGSEGRKERRYAGMV